MGTYVWRVPFSLFAVKGAAQKRLRRTISPTEPPGVDYIDESYLRVKNKVKKKNKKNVIRSHDHVAAAA